MSQPGEVVCVCKLASVVQQRDNLVPTSGRLLRGRSVHPSCKKTLAELVVLSQRWFGDIYTCNRGCLAQSLSLLQYLTAPRIDFPGVPGSSNGATSVQPRRKPSAVQQADRRAESSGCPCRDRVGI
ncbi:hypothetical protein BHE74_00032701 [Ensete ventricosum]|nr:hypothetical protein BHE74_00032701 [Ensete ventricosum]